MSGYEAEDENNYRISIHKQPMAEAGYANTNDMLIHVNKIAWN